MYNPCHEVFYGASRAVRTFGVVQYATAPYALLQGFLLFVRVAGALQPRSTKVRVRPVHFTFVRLAAAPPAFMYSSCCDAFYGASRAVRTFGVVQYATAPYALLRGFLLFVRVAALLVLLIQRP